MLVGRCILVFFLGWLSRMLNICKRWVLCTYNYPPQHQFDAVFCIENHVTFFSLRIMRSAACGRKVLVVGGGVIPRDWIFVNI